MANFRFIAGTDWSDANRRFLTFRSSRSVSSCPPGPPTVAVGGNLLLYAPTKSPTNVSPHGGVVGSDLAIQLVFWGDWWNGAGQALKTSLEGAVAKIVAGPYTNALDQYGVSQPSYRGSYLAGGSPKRFGWSDVQTLVQGLINNNVFPEQDDPGGWIGYFVMMPAGSVDTTMPRPCGAHGFELDETRILGLPVDVDYAWVAYVNNGSLDAMTSCFSHELAELLTDPGQDAWYVDGAPRDSSEIGDLCDIRENWVDGVKVRSYWSLRDQKCVIPTDASYSVCISGTIDESDREQLAKAKDHPESPQGPLNFLVPACDFSALEFEYTTYKHVEVASLRATATGYHAPVFSWTVAGQPVSGAGTLTPSVEVTYPGPGGRTRKSSDPVTLKFSATGDTLTLTNDQTSGNFDVAVAVTVDEDPATSAQAENGTRTTGLVVSYVGLSVDEPDYESAVKRCRDGAFEVWKQTHRKTKPKAGPVNPGPLHEGDLELLRNLPGWITAAERDEVRKAIVYSAHLRAEAPEAADALRAVLLGNLAVL